MHILGDFFDIIALQCGVLMSLIIISQSFSAPDKYWLLLLNSFDREKLTPMTGKTRLLVFSRGVIELTHDFEN